MKQAILIVLLLLSSKVLGFQDTSELVLTITDQNNAIIKNVNINIYNSTRLVRNFSLKNSGQAEIKNLNAYTYILEISAQGFNIYREEITLKRGENHKTVKLQIEELIENVDIVQDKQSKALDEKSGAFNVFLTKEEIEALPEDPRQIIEVLQKRYGVDAEFIIDGFSSGGVPPKSQIASIRINLSSFDGEYHRLGVTRIEIVTKAVSTWRLSSHFSFEDSLFNARNVFAEEKGKSQLKGGRLLLSGPIKKDRSSFRTSISINKENTTDTILAFLPSGNVRDNFLSGNITKNFDSNMLFNLGEFQTLNLGYSFGASRSTNQGVGGFNLRDRAYDYVGSQHRLRLSHSGNLGSRFFNEFRFEGVSKLSKSIPFSHKETHIVLDAFTSGGSGSNREDKEQYLMIADNFLFGIGKIHALKVGALLEYYKKKQIIRDNSNGTYIFPSIEDYVAKRPSIYIKRVDVNRVDINQTQAGIFINDDIRVSTNLRMSFGMRYELQNNLRNSNNFSPRFGFSWSPSKDGRAVFRGGVGIFYQWLEPNITLNVNSLNYNRRGEVFVRNPVFDGSYVIDEDTLLVRNWRIDENLRNPYIVLSQLGFSLRVNENSTLRLLYGYSKALHTFRSRMVNTLFTEDNISFQVESSGFAINNSLNTTYETQISKRISLYLSYKLSKSISDSEGVFSLPSNSLNVRTDRGYSNDDRRHNLYTSIGWSPFEGVFLSGLYRVISPLPYNIVIGRDENLDTVFNDRIEGINRNSARGAWFYQADASIRWAIGLSKNKGGVVTSSTGATATKGKTLILDINAENVFNQTNFRNFVGVQNSVYFRHPISAHNPRKLSFGISFIF